MWLEEIWRDHEAHPLLCPWLTAILFQTKYLTSPLRERERDREREGGRGGGRKEGKEWGKGGRKGGREERRREKEREKERKKKKNQATHLSANGSFPPANYSNTSLSSLRESFFPMFNLDLLRSSLDSLHTGCRGKIITFLLLCLWRLLDCLSFRFLFSRLKRLNSFHLSLWALFAKIYHHLHCTFLDSIQFVHIFA